PALPGPATARAPAAELPANSTGVRRRRSSELPSEDVDRLDARAAHGRDQAREQADEQREPGAVPVELRVVVHEERLALHEALLVRLQVAQGDDHVVAEGVAERRADERDDRALEQERPEDVAAAEADAAQDRDVARLLQHDHDLDREDAEA